MASSEAYSSFFTGDELDYAIASALGNKYRGVTTPGCHLIGDTTDKFVDFDDLLIPGKYTVYFYTNGPEKLMSGDQRQQYTSFSVRPVFLQIFATGGDHLYQTIMTCAKLYWRDMWAAEDKDEFGHIPWRDVDLGIEQAVIRNSLEMSPTGVDESLSQRMGTLLVDTIEKLMIGNVNLLDYSNGVFLYEYKNVNTRDIDRVDAVFRHYWNMTSGSTIESEEMSTVLQTYPKFPMFDDLDTDYVTLFKTNPSGGSSTFASYIDSNDGHHSNRIPVSANTKYTASVYLVYDPKFLEMLDTDIAYISICNNGVVASTKEYKLNLMGSKAAYEALDPPVEAPEDRYCLNHILDNTEYDFEHNDPSEDGVEDWRDTYSGRFKREGKAASDLGYFRLTVTLDEDIISAANLSNISIQFGTRIHNAVTPSDQLDIMFALPKVEYGEYATQYNHSWGDLYYYFTNCEEFFGVPIDIDGPEDFEDQDSFVYVPEYTDPETRITTPAHFNAEPIAVGGGGGFVVHKKDDLGIRDTNTNDDRYNDDETDADALDLLDRLKISYAVDSDNSFITKDQQSIYEDYAERNPGDPSQPEYPRYDKVLVFNKMTSELMYWDDLYDTHELYAEKGAFVSINKPFVLRECATDPDTHEDVNGPKPVDYDVDKSYTQAYAGKNTFWLHKPHPGPTANVQGKAATIKYYDEDEKTWLTAKADPGAVYVVQSTAPGLEWLGKFWIDSTTNAIYYSEYDSVYNRIVWKPVMAVWGANPST